MKLLLLVTAVAVVGCASGSKKKADAKPMEKKTEMKAEKKMPAKKEEKKMAKKTMAKSTFGSTVTCSYGQVERVLENKASESGGCEVLYTKDGGTSTIATAQNELDYCQSVVDKISNKLTNAGFNCK